MDNGQARPTADVEGRGHREIKPRQVRVFVGKYKGIQPKFATTCVPFCAHKGAPERF